MAPGARRRNEEQQPGGALGELNMQLMDGCVVTEQFWVTINSPT